MENQPPIRPEYYELAIFLQSMHRPWLYITSAAKEIVGASLTWLTLNRFPCSTGFSPKRTRSCVVGLKDSGIRAMEPGARPATESEVKRISVCVASDIVYLSLFLVAAVDDDDAISLYDAQSDEFSQVVGRKKKKSNNRRTLRVAKLPVGSI